MKTRSALVGGVVMALGCSSGSGTTEVGKFCNAFVAAAANVAYDCRGGSRQAYDLAIQASGLCNTVSTTIAASQATFDRDVAATCLAKMASLECWQDTPSDCFRVFVGTVADGGSCHTSLPFEAEEYLPGSRCVSPGGQCTGRCMRYRVAGEPCYETADLSDQCAPSLFCDSVTNTCVASTAPPVAIGDACTFSGACLGDDARLQCVGQNGVITSGTEMGTCQPPGDIGPCMYGSDCRAGVCPGATASTPGMCMPAKHLGDACTPAASECAPGTYCGPTRTCILLPPIGQPCAGDDGQATECVNGVCDSRGLCVPYGRLGQPCEPGFIFDSCLPYKFECEETTGTCQPTCLPGNACGAPGQPCCANQQCNEGATCNGNVCR